MSETTLKIVSVQTGHCQINYRVKNHEGQNIYYCFMEMGQGKIEMMRTSQPFYQGMEQVFEPSHKASPKSTIYVEKPKGDSKLEELVRGYIANHPNMLGI